MLALYFAFTLLFLLQCAFLINGSPTGAPEAACKTYKPNHGHQPQPTSTFPFSVSTTTDLYSSPNDKITVTLMSPAGKPAFKGFLLVARNENGKPFGSWKSTSGHALSCSAITHNNNEDKTSVIMTWQPPSNATSGKVSMSIAVVQNVSTFWINIPVVVASSISRMDTSASNTNHRIIATTKSPHRIHPARIRTNANSAITIKPIKVFPTTSKPKIIQASKIN